METGNRRPVTIRYDRELGEYSVTPDDEGENATYYTDSYADAVGTARVMANGGDIKDKTPFGRKTKGITIE